MTPAMSVGLASQRVQFNTVFSTLGGSRPMAKPQHQRRHRVTKTSSRYSGVGGILWLRPSGLVPDFDTGVLLQQNTFGQVTTDRVIVMNSPIKHISERHKTATNFQSKKIGARIDLDAMEFDGKQHGVWREELGMGVVTFGETAPQPQNDQRRHERHRQPDGRTPKTTPDGLTETEWRRRCPGFVLAPQCPSNNNWQFELPTLKSLIDAWRNDPRVDRRRIYLTGLSMGGHGAWHLVAAEPD